MRKLSITRALSELKLLKKRHEKLLGECNPIAVKHGSRLMGEYVSYKPEDFEKNIDPGMQAVEKLEDLIFEIKSKINYSNSKTIVKIGTKEMTVQEAIVQKDLISFKEARLKMLKEKLLNARALYERAVNDNKMNIAKQVQDLSGKSADKKVDPELEKNISESVEKLYKVEFVDHNLVDKIKVLENEIEEFNTNVDFALSESNSITTIEISD